jgi:hypothetical protein
MQPGCRSNRAAWRWSPKGAVWELVAVEPSYQRFHAKADGSSPEVRPSGSRPDAAAQLASSSRLCGPVDLVAIDMPLSHVPITGAALRTTLCRASMARGGAPLIRRAPRDPDQSVKGLKRGLRKPDILCRQTRFHYLDRLRFILDASAARRPPRRPQSLRGYAGRNRLRLGRNLYTGGARQGSTLCNLDS